MGFLMEDTADGKGSYSDHGADRQRRNCTVGNVRKDANPKFKAMEATNEEFQEVFLKSNCWALNAGKSPERRIYCMVRSK